MNYTAKIMLTTGYNKHVKIIGRCCDAIIKKLQYFEKLAPGTVIVVFHNNNVICRSILTYKGWGLLTDLGFEKWIRSPQKVRESGLNGIAAYKE